VQKKNIRSKFLKTIPELAGVYFMKDSRGRVLYIGKASNLRRRIFSYFQKAQNEKIEKLLNKISDISYLKTDSVIEALMLESQLIKKFNPPFNVKEKDDKSFLWVKITDEEFPRVLLVRGGGDFGPFTSASSLKEALRILRRIFPFNLHSPERIGKFSRPCLDRELGLCPGTCIGAITKKEYKENLKNIRLFFQGKKKEIIKILEQSMKKASYNLDFEKADQFKKRIFALKHIQDVSLVEEKSSILLADNDKKGTLRIEGYDISNIAGKMAVGAMVVFVNGQPQKSEYRRFKIKNVVGINDVGMLKEVLRRRFQNKWALPDLILVDGGRGQVNATCSVLSEFYLSIPVVGIAKGYKRKKNEFIGDLPDNISPQLLIRVRDEAHRFAISYHKNLRAKEFLIFTFSLFILSKVILILMLL
jgi:excinuclease ABC subunit C